MAINKHSRFPSRKEVNAKQDGKVAAPKVAAPKISGSKVAAPKLKADDKKVLTSAGIKVDTLDPKSIERILKSIENLLQVTKEQIAQNNAGVKSGKTVNIKVQPKPEATEQFVRTIGELGKVWREGDYADYKDDFKESLSKAKEYGVAIGMFGKTIVDEKFGNIAIYGVSVRGGNCKFKCVTLKGREVSVDADKFIAF